VLVEEISLVEVAPVDPDSLGAISVGADPDPEAADSELTAPTEVTSLEALVLGEASEEDDGWLEWDELSVELSTVLFWVDSGTI
jgi:hypothetical protein